MLVTVMWCDVNRERGATRPNRAAVLRLLTDLLPLGCSKPSIDDLRQTGRGVLNEMVGG